MDLEDCLPDALRERSPAITKISAGMSGAGVYRVETGGEAYVLRVAGAAIDPGTWRRQLAIERRAAEAGLAPRVVHVDEARRAVVSEFVLDRSFAALFTNPATRETALALLAGTFRRMHAQPIPGDAPPPRDPRELLADAWLALRAAHAVPAFADALVRREIDAPLPRDDRAPVLGHNDPNPSNLVFDGANLLLLDWDAAGPMHPFWDLATVAMFLRMDDATCARLLSLYTGEPGGALPETFRRFRRLSAVMCGAIIVRLACLSGRAGDAAVTLEQTPSLGECYQRMRTGALDLASGTGQWQFGLALLKEGATL